MQVVGIKKRHRVKARIILLLNKLGVCPVTMTTVANFFQDHAITVLYCRMQPDFFFPIKYDFD